MLEARITKAVVAHNEKLETTLMAVAEYYGEALNIKVKYEWEHLDHDGFISDLRETIAEEFDLPVYHVDVQADKLLKKMKFFDLHSTGLVH